MATYPVCNHDVATPSFLNLDAWRWLVGPNCKARLEMKSPRSFLLSPLMAPLFVLARQGRVFEVIAFAFMFATIFLCCWKASVLRYSSGKSPCPSPPSG